MGYINPYLYILFIILLPINLAHWKVILLGFLTGLTIDMFGDSGGIHSTAALVTAYLRPRMLSFAFGVSYEQQTVKFYKSPLNERLMYVVQMVLVHHLVLFILTFFNFRHVILILKNTLFSALFTVLLILIVTTLFQKARR